MSRFNIRTYFVLSNNARCAYVSLGFGAIGIQSQLFGLGCFFVGLFPQRIWPSTYRKPVVFDLFSTDISSLNALKCTFFAFPKCCFSTAWKALVASFCASKL